MKILVVQDRLRSGGTERQALLLTAGFSAAGHDAKLLTFRPGGALAQRSPGVRHRALQPFDSRLDWWAPGLRSTARALAPDIVVCMGRMANCYGASLQAALPHAAVINTVRTGKPLPWLFRRSLPRVRQVVANSHETRARLLQQHALPPAHVTVIHNALVFPPPAGLAARDAALRGSHGASPQTCVLLCVAMFRPEKNQRALIEIVRRLPRDLDWQLWLAGDGPARAACVQATQAAGLNDRVKFLGWLADPSPLYAAADLAVLTSTRESLSNFLIEAQAHGLPAVAYDALGVAEAFSPGVTGELVRAGDENGFRAVLERFIRDPARRHEFAARAQPYALDHFSPQRQLQAYLDLFAQLTRRAP